MRAVRAGPPALWYHTIMTRKSAQQRISDTEAAIAQWEAAGLSSDRRMSFMRDALARIRSAKGLTTSQREWLDALCAEGPPAPKGDPALRARIEAALPHLDARGKEALEGFRGTITRGYQLSEKQAAFMTRLLEGAERIAREGRWQPGPELRAKADFAWSILDGRNSMWKGSHPGTMNVCVRYDAWRKSPETNHIDEWVVNKMLESCAPAMRELENPRFEEGEMVTAIDLQRVGIVCSGPIALNGKVGYDVLLDGRPIACLADTIKRVK
jgi:hypothetical protein